jgi:hypothetical protein
MWPSEELASRLYNLANWGLIAGLVVGFVSTVLVVWMGNTKESYLQARLGAMTSSAAEANERAAEATKTAEQERIERLKLEAKLAPRRVTGEQRAAFAVACGTAQKVQISVSGMLGVADADDFADDLARVLKDCGYNVTLHKSMLLMPTPRALRMYVGANRHAEAAALSDSLRHSGIATEAVECLPAQDVNSLQLQVGPKAQ